MKVSLLNRFQGVLVGAAIAEMMPNNRSLFSGNRFNKPSNTSKNAIASDTIQTSEQNKEFADDDHVFDLAQILIKITSCIIQSQSIPDDYRDTFLSCSPSSRTCYEDVNINRSAIWLQAIALIPLTLYLHEESMTVEGIVEQFHLLDLGPLNSISSNLSPAQHSIVLTLRMILNEQLNLKTHISLLIDHLNDGFNPQDSIFQEALLVSQDIRQNRQGSFSLIQSLQQRLDFHWTSVAEVTCSSTQTTQYGQNSVDMMEAVSMCIVLYCFLSSPRDYNTSILNLRHLFQQSHLPTYWTGPAHALLGALIGGYNGVWNLPIEIQCGNSRMINNKVSERPAFSNHRSYYWNRLNSLGAILWSIWSGIDTNLIFSNDSTNVQQSSVITASPNVIRMFGY